MQTNFFSPQSEWLPPKNFPDLRDAKEIAFDLKKQKILNLKLGVLVG